MGIRRVLISAILTLGVAGSILAGSALPAAAPASAAPAHATTASGPYMFFHT
jgi:hypothetical protein